MTAAMNVGTLVGYLTLDDTGVDKGVRGATAKIKGFAKSGAQEGSKAGTAIGKAAGDKTVEAYGKSESKLVEKTKSVFGKVGGVAAGILGGIGVAQILTKGWDRLTGIENAQAKLRGLGHDAAAVETIMGNALASVKGTAFGLGEAATIAANAVASGIQPGQQLESTLRLVADSASIAGISLNEMGAIYNKVAANGKLTTEVMLQLHDRGVPVLTELAKHFGVTNAEAQKMVTDSKVSFQDFAQVMEGTVGGAAIEMGKTTTGSLANLGAAAGRFGATLLAEVQPAIKSLADYGISAFDGLGDAASAAFSIVGSLPDPLKRVALALAALGIAKATGALAKLSEWMLLARVRASELADVSGPHGLGKSLSSLGKTLGKGGAIAGGLLVIDSVVSAFADLRNMAAEADSTVNSLAQSLIDNNGVWDSTIKKQREMEVISSDVFKSLTKGGADYGETLRLLTGTSGDLTGASESLVKAIGELSFSQAEQLGYMLQTGKAAQEQADAYLENRDRLKDLNTEYNNARRALNDYDSGQVKTTQATQDANVAYNNARRALNDYTANAAHFTTAQSRAEQKTVRVAKALFDAADAANAMAAGSSAVRTALDELSGRSPDAEEAIRRFNGVISDAASALKLGEEDTGTFGKAIDATTGIVDTSTTAGQKLYDWITDAATAARDSALAQAALAGETGSLTDAATAGADAQQQQIDAFTKAARQAGLTKREIRDLIETYFDVPESIETTVLGEPDFSKVDTQIEALRRMTITIPVTANVTTTGIRGDRGWTIASNATGGAIDGPGPKGQDSVLSWLAPGEHVWTDREVDKVGGQQAMYNLRRAVMGAPGFASGGSLTPPTAQALSGLPGPQYGATQSGVVGALAQFAGLVDASGEAAASASKKLKDLTARYADDSRERQRNYDRVRLAERESVNDAKERVKELRAEGASKKQLADAQKAVEKAEAKRVERVRDVLRAMNKANAADEKKIALAQKEAAAADARSIAMANLAKASSGLQRQQESLAGQLDTTNARLGEARSALDGLVQASQQMKNSISSGFLGGSAISQFASGVPVESMLAKLQQQVGMSQGISQSITSLAGRGLNSTMLEDLARMGLSGAGLASALAGATDSQLRELNSLQGQLKAAADATGTVVADAIYSNDIKIAERQVAALTAQTNRLEMALRENAQRLEDLMGPALIGLDNTVSTSADRAASTVAKAVSGAVSAAAAAAKTTTKGKGLSS